MTDTEIKKALECCICSTSRNDCEDLNCPACKDIGCYFMDRSTEDYPESLIQEIGNSALDLINRKDAELQVCNEALDNSMKLNTKLQAEIERLKEENQNLKDQFCYLDIECERLEKETSEQEAEIERLQSMNQAKLDMIHDIWEDLDAANFVIEKLKNQLNEEIKDFNQRLRQEIKANTDYNGCIYYKTAYKIIDNILEEIINENE